MSGNESHSSVPPSEEQASKKMSATEDKSPADQLMELLVYAPVGMLYEYQDVLDQVVKRGRSQVQLAKVMGKMVAQRGQNEVEDNVSEVLTAAAETVAKGITEFGAAIGLAPPKPSTTSGPDLAPAVMADKELPAVEDERVADPEETSSEKPLPIAGYDTLKAKEVISLLPDLDRDQRARIRQHESANRGRKTVMAKLDSLDG